MRKVTDVYVFMFSPLVIGLAILSFGRHEWWVTAAAGACFGVFAAFLPVWRAELRKVRASRALRS